LGEYDYHLVIHVCIFNSKNEMLIQKRQPSKKLWPNMWDITIGGAVQSGETSTKAAERETFEEIGYRVDLSNDRAFFTINFDNGFDDYFLIEEDIDIKDLRLQYDEVEEVKWADKDEVLQLAKENKFINYWFLEKLFEIRKQRGAYTK
ncbi:MAG: NUDIX hydrolase, partial [Senegalia sp. (in: firmicutes)]